MRTKATRSRCFASMFAWILNTKPVNCSSVGFDDAGGRLARRRRGRELEELAQERLDAEVRERAAEEHRRQLAREHRLRRRTDGPLRRAARCPARAARATRRRAARASAGSSSDPTCDVGARRAVVLAALEQVHLLAPAVVDADERAVAVDRPGDRMAGDAEVGLDVARPA